MPTRIRPHNPIDEKRDVEELNLNLISEDKNPDAFEDNQNVPHFLLAHVISHTHEFIQKLARNKLNINTTLITPRNLDLDETKSDADNTVPNLHINTYADSDWNTLSGVFLSGERCLFLGFFPRDISSYSFEGFQSDGSITPEIMDAMNKWVKSSERKKFRKGSLKLTPQSALDKLIEISKRRVDAQLDHASTQYFDKSGNKIYTGIKNKFSSKKANYDGWKKIKMPQDRLRHNETHVRATIADIEGSFITKDNWDNNSYLALTSLQNIHRAIKHRLKTANEADVITIQARTNEQIAYYQSSLKLLNKKEENLVKLLSALESGQNIDFKDLNEAFKRKKSRNKNFNETNPQNKKIWIQKHLDTIGLDKSYLRSMIKHTKLNSSTGKIEELLERNLKIHVYDSSTGQINEVLESELLQKLEKITMLLAFKQSAEAGLTIIVRNVKNDKLHYATITAITALSSLYVHPVITSGVDMAAFFTNSLGALASIHTGIFVTGSLDYVSNCVQNIRKKKTEFTALLGTAAISYFYLYPEIVDSLIGLESSSVVAANFVAASASIVATTFVSSTTIACVNLLKKASKGIFNYFSTPGATIEPELENDLQTQDTLINITPNPENIELQDTKSGVEVSEQNPKTSVAAQSKPERIIDETKHHNR